MTQPLTVGHVTWSPDYRHSPREESGDTTFVSTSVRLRDQPPSTFDHLMRQPPANDNHVAERPRVVGLMGFAGSGKTTVANILRKEHGFDGPHIKAPLRAAAGTLLREFGISERMVDRYLDGDLKRERIPQFRRSGTELQQFIGTELGRDFCYENLWLDEWLRRTDAILARGGRVVQESVRFTNEADSIRARGGIILLVTRHGVGAVNGHISEALPTTPDAIIKNNGSIADLYSTIATIVA